MKGPKALTPVRSRPNLWPGWLSIHLLWLAPLCASYALLVAWTLDTISSTFHHLQAAAPQQTTSTRIQSAQREPLRPRFNSTATPPAGFASSDFETPTCPGQSAPPLVEVIGADPWHPPHIPERTEPLPKPQSGPFRSQASLEVKPIRIATLCHNNACRLCPEPVRVHLRIDPIDIADDPSHTSGSCHYLKNLAHEHTHAVFAQQVETHHRTRLTTELTKLLRNERTRTIDPIEVPLARQRLARQLGLATRRAFAAMQFDLDRSQELIHTAQYQSAERTALHNCLLTGHYQPPPFPRLK